MESPHRDINTKLCVCARMCVCICVFLSPMGPPLCRSVTSACKWRPLWQSCTRRIPRPLAVVGGGPVHHAAGRRDSRGTCPSPTWKGPPTRLSYHTAEEQRHLHEGMKQGLQPLLLSSRKTLQVRGLKATSTCSPSLTASNK